MFFISFQLQIIGPLLKIRLVNDGELIKRMDMPSNNQISTTNQVIYLNHIHKEHFTQHGGTPNSTSSLGIKQRNHEIDVMNNHMKFVENGL